MDFEFDSEEHYKRVRARLMRRIQQAVLSNSGVSFSPEETACWVVVAQSIVNQTVVPEQPKIRNYRD